MSNRVPSHRLHRRDALKTTAAISTGFFLGSQATSARAESPNEKLNIACIGVGGRGGANVKGCSSQNLVAFADVDDRRAGKTLKSFPNVKTYRDFRKLYDELGSKLDAVVISTPDHTHFHPAYMAMQLGLHVYLEKPLAHNVWETRTLTNLAKEKGLATQLGAQRHANSNMARVVELVQSGAIGPVTKVVSWIDSSRGMPNVPTDEPQVPDHLDYDLWVGPAPLRPYHPSFCPYGWRFWWDYGTGETGNWGCHILDIPFWALELKYPTKVSASGPEVDPERAPKSIHSILQFPARKTAFGDQPAVELHWVQGKPNIWDQLQVPEKQRKGINTVFVGKQGVLLAGFNDRLLWPEKKFSGFEPPEETIPKSPGFHKEWLLACKGGSPATCDFVEYSGPLAESVLLANVAYRTGDFEWDAQSLQTKGNEQAQSLIREEYRKGWEID